MEKTTRLILWVAVGVAVLIVTTQPVLAGIVNGGFELPVDPDDDSGWKVSGTVNIGWFDPKNAVLTQGDEPESVLYQKVTLLEGEDWLSFYLSIESELAGDCDIFTATFDRAEIYTWSNNASACVLPATTITFDVSGYDQGPSFEYDLIFTLNHDPDDYITSVTIDDVMLTPNSPMVPVPGALLLGGLGSALVVLMKRSGVFEIVS